MRTSLRAAVSAAAAALLALTVPAAEAYLIQERGGFTSGTNGIVLGPDGNFWVAEQYGTPTGSVARMAPDGTILGRFSVGDNPTSLAVGPGGRVWVSVTGADKLVWIDATSGAPSTHDVPTTGISTCGPVAIVSGGDGRMYFSLPADGSAASCPVGQLGSVSEDGSGGVTGVTDRGNVYDLDVSGGKLFATDFDGEVVRRMSLGAGLPVESVVTATGGPDGIAADGAGNVWVTLYSIGAVGRFPSGQNGGSVQTLFPTSGAISEPFGIAAGPDGRIYVGGKASSNLARIASDGTFTLFAVPNAEPWQIAAGPDGDVWFTDQGSSRVLRFLSTAPRATTGAAAPASATSASLTAKVDPRGNATQVVFDYGQTAAYGATTPPIAVANGSGAVDVSAVLAGLAPSATYHVRVRATNGEGSAVGANTTFDTPQGLVDADGDGVPPPADCNDADPRIRPGATDTPGDRIDQDCSGRDAPFPVLAELTTYAYRNAGSAKLLTSLQLTRLAGGETAMVTCTGGRRRGCSFKTKRYTKLKPGKRSLTRLFRGRSLRSGAVVAVLVTKPATVGSALTLKFRGRRAPRVTRACLPPGAKRPQRCG